MWYAISRLLPSLVKASPWLCLLFTIVSALHGISFVIITIYTQRFIDASTLFATGEYSLGMVLGILTILGFAYIFNKIINSSFGVLYRMMGRKIQTKSRYLMNEKVARLDPLLYENTKILEDIAKSNEGLNNSTWFILTFLVSITFYIPYLIFLGTYLYAQDPILVITILLAFLPTVLTQTIRTKIFFNLTSKTAPIQRKKDYFGNCITSREYFRETRHLGAFSYFIDLFTKNLKEENKLTLRTSIKANLIELLFKCMTVLCYGFIIYLLYISVMSGKITIGVFAAVFYSLDRLFSLIRELVCDNFSYLSQDLGSITNYLRFLNLPDRVGKDVTFNGEIEIELKNVSFQYPQSDVQALNNISLHIRNHETVAIVGENGSGKSTLIRLLIGLYCPSKGEVLINGINTKAVSMQSLFSNISAVFQKYQKYQLTLGENISISDVERSEECDAKDEALNKAGLSKEAPVFVKGYDTMLSREFDGIDLSGGQWQKIATARGYFRKHSFIVLDEPTAAIDPIEETQIYQRFIQICKGKTSVIVTHRLGSAKIADRIFVMKQGNLVEIGTHDELMAQAGEYARLYQLQQKWYI